MALAEGARPAPELPAPEIREDPELARELTQRLPAEPWTRALSVTDLLDVRRAYWRQSRGPVSMTPERRARLDAGRDFHRAIDMALPEEGSFEVRVRRHGVSARIDLLSDVPVEIKTGDSAPPDDLVEERPEYIEQIGMYCGLLEKGDARLVHVHRSETGAPLVRAFDVAFSEPEGLRTEILARAAELRSAVAAQDPRTLPACRWFGRGCEFQAAGVCDCRGGERPPSAAIVDRVVGLVVRGDVQARWEAALSATGPALPAPALHRYRDLVYPRRAYFEAVEPVEPAAPRAVPLDHPPSGVYDGAVGALEGGPVGDVRRLIEHGRAPEEEVAGWRGEPYIVRTSRAWSRVRAEEAFARFPQYATELGFRCATTGTRRARVVLAYERAKEPNDRLQVLEYSFGPALEAYTTLFRARLQAFEAAVAARSPAGLAPCAGWMTADCAYRARCGCAEELARSQR